MRPSAHSPQDALQSAERWGPVKVMSLRYLINILMIILLKLNPITADSQTAGDPPDGGDGLPVCRAPAVQD